MSNSGEKIVELQNQELNIKYLAAQSNLYTKAKKLFLLQCVIAVPIPICIALIVISIKNIEQYNWLFDSYAIVASLSEVFIDAYIVKIKQTAASIQEMFDHCVLGIEWNKIAVAEKPRPETVFKHFSNYEKKSSINKFYDWYSPVIKSLKTNLAVVFCQRTNCTYDFSIRKKYSFAVGILAILTFCALLLIGCLTGITLKSFIVKIFFPSIPIFILAGRQIFKNKEAIINLKCLKENLEEVLDNSRIDTIVEEKCIRQIQDQIYLNRTLSPALPDWVFKLLRNKLEAQMHFAVEVKINELKHR